MFNFNWKDIIMLSMILVFKLCSKMNTVVLVHALKLLFCCKCALKNVCPLRQYLRDKNCSNAIFIKTQIILL